MCLSFRSITDKQVTARKPHRCEWCAGPIAKGEKARYRAYVLEGEFNSGHMHLDCYEALTKSVREAICEGWMPGDFERGEIAA